MPSASDLRLNLPQPETDLMITSRDPGETGDKGRDAVRHRAELAVCEAKRAGWQFHWEEVVKQYGAK